MKREITPPEDFEALLSRLARLLRSSDLPSEFAEALITQLDPEILKRLRPLLASVDVSYGK